MSTGGLMAERRSARTSSSRACSEGAGELVVGLHAGAAALFDFRDDGFADAGLFGEFFLGEAAAAAEFSDAVAHAVALVACRISHRSRPYLLEPRQLSR